MAAYEVLLLNTAIPQIQAAQSGDTYVVPRDIAFSAALTLSAGTANGVPYLNGSKVLTSGSALTFNGSQLGIVGTATTAATSISLSGSTTGYQRILASNTSGGAQFGIEGAVGGSIAVNTTAYATVIGDYANNPLQIITNNTVRATIDSSGNLGLGVTPSAWGAAYRGVIQSTFGGYGLFTDGSNNNQMGIASNAFHNGTNWIYYASSTATLFQQKAGAHQWFNAASGTAGNAITFTQAMTLDASGRLGIGVSNPSVGLVVAYGTDGIIGNYYSSSGNNSRISFSNASLLNNNVSIGSASDALVMYTNNTERARITSGGNLKLGGTVDRATTVGTNHLDIFNGTAPVGTLTDGISIYSSSGEAYVMDAAGNATLFSPHDAETNEWIFKSKHTPTGKVLKIDVERLLKFVNDHFGLDAVHEFVEE